MPICTDPWLPPVLSGSKAEVWLPQYQAVTRRNVSRRHHFGLFTLLDKLWHILSWPQTHCRLASNCRSSCLTSPVPGPQAESQVWEVLGD